MKNVYTYFCETAFLSLSLSLSLDLPTSTHPVYLKLDECWLVNST